MGIKFCSHAEAFKAIPVLFGSPQWRFLSCLTQVVGAAVDGTVSDESGAVLPGARVVIKSIETGTKRELVTDDAGRYSVPSLAIGRYAITVDRSRLPGANKDRTRLGNRTKR